MALRVLPSDDPRSHQSSNRPEQEDPHSISIIIDSQPPEGHFIESIGKVANKANDQCLARSNPTQEREHDDIHSNRAGNGLSKGEIQHIWILHRALDPQQAREADVVRVIA